MAELVKQHLAKIGSTLRERVAAGEAPEDLAILVIVNTKLGHAECEVFTRQKLHERLGQMMSGSPSAGERARARAAQVLDPAPSGLIWLAAVTDHAGFIVDPVQWPPMDMEEAPAPAPKPGGMGAILVGESVEAYHDRL